MQNHMKQELILLKMLRVIYSRLRLIYERVKKEKCTSTRRVLEMIIQLMEFSADGCVHDPI